MYTAAIIGAGKPTHTWNKGGGHQIGYTHAAAYQRNPNVRLIGVADIVTSHLDAFNERFDTVGYTNYREMLTTQRPDIVSICTYVGLHAQMIEAAIDAGVKAVFCEKPFVATPIQLAHIRTRIAQSQTKVAIAHVRRYRTAFQHARQLISNGSIGTPLACVAGIDGWDLSEWGSHWLDMYRFLLDEAPISWVMGQARVRDTRGYGHAMEDHATVHIGFVNGTRGILDGGKALPGSDIMTIVGSAGMITMHSEESFTVINASGATTHDYTGHVTWDGCWDASIAGIVEWLNSNTEPTIGFTHTWQSAELNLASYVSMVERDRIDLPMQSTLDMWPVELLVPPEASV
ncbi:MAG: Gfo/Idh/MocA family protein [Roseiflexaceae bacterium]|jgi:predicted dehydrogenase